MKFGKEFQSQMVPEWQQAYMNYGSLKNVLKVIKVLKQRNKPVSGQPSGLRRSMSLYQAFSGLSHRAYHTMPPPDVENQVIVVHTVEERAETMFLNAADEGGDLQLRYFKNLDDEFNKVVSFYKQKVGEVMKEAGVLNKQMEALIAFRVKVENPLTNNILDVESDKLASETSTTPLSATQRSVQMDTIVEENSVKQGTINESGDDNEVWEMKPVDLNNDKVQKPHGIAPVEILQRVKFNNAPETPLSTIKGLLNYSSQVELKFSKDNLRKAEAQLKNAFVEFYQKLRLLKSYSFLNLMAFSKIMKKYDKITSRSASKPYMKVVDNSYLGSSDEVSKLMERVEIIFIKHFSNSNRRKGMNILRPQKRREKHRTTFFMGFLVGCTIALILALVLIVRARHLVEEHAKGVYMNTMFPLYSLFGYIVLHMLMYAANVFFWRRYRVNYAFIFGFKQGTELGFREVFLVSFCISVLALAGVLWNLDMEMDPMTRHYKNITELVPLVLVVLVIVVMVCPLNIIYRSSRQFLLVCLFHCILAPLYKVTLPDFFLADQLTSQVEALRSLEFYICYYGWGDYKKRQNNCQSSDVFKTFYYILAAIPYMWRFLQCLRRLVEEKDAMQGYNSLKYLATVIAVCARTAYVLNQETSWKIVALITSIITATVSTYWDLHIDWGLFQRNSKNPLLRDKLLVPHKSVYFAAIVLNVLLRFAWLQTVTGINIPSMHKRTMIALMASLEILRRGLWNFFRLENEHLNNVGKYRAFKSVPLPFNYEDEDKDV